MDFAMNDDSKEELRQVEKDFWDLTTKVTEMHATLIEKQKLERELKGRLHEKMCKVNSTMHHLRLMDKVKNELLDKVKELALQMGNAEDAFIKNMQLIISKSDINTTEFKRDVEQQIEKVNQKIAEMERRKAKVEKEIEKNKKIYAMDTSYDNPNLDIIIKENEKLLEDYNKRREMRESLEKDIKYLKQKLEELNNSSLV